VRIVPHPETTGQALTGRPDRRLVIGIRFITSVEIVSVAFAEVGVQQVGDMFAGRFVHAGSSGGQTGSRAPMVD
jgi:hypothetical protein